MTRVSILADHRDDIGRASVAWRWPHRGEVVMAVIRIAVGPWDQARVIESTIAEAAANALGNLCELPNG